MAHPEPFQSSFGATLQQAETGVILAQARELQKPPETRIGKEFPLELSLRGSTRPWGLGRNVQLRLRATWEGGGHEGLGAHSTSQAPCLPADAGLLLRGACLSGAPSGSEGVKQRGPP